MSAPGRCAGRRLASWLVITLAACGEPPEPAPPEACAASWAVDSTRELVAGLAAATRAGRTVWTGYRLSDGWYVVDAGSSDSGASCLGVWRAGRALGFARLAASPTLLTPLYGYYFSRTWGAGSDADMLDRAGQPEPVREWLETLGVESAVILPARPTGFPLVLSPFAKVQLALHEGFHVFVQAPRWYAAHGTWPAWDRQPDRPGVQACYAGTPTAEAAIQSERDTLALLVTRLLDGDSLAACHAGTAFLAQRTARYEALSGVRVARHDSTPGDCREAEDLLELEEGAADYASWTVLYDLGLTSRERLVRRYQTQQRDIFYLTGAMQLHAIQLMAPGRMPDATREIVSAPDPRAGSLTSALRRSLAAYCR